MIRRLLLVISIAVGVVVVPYWVGKRAPGFLDPMPDFKILYWCNGVLILIPCAILACVFWAFIGEPIYKYIKTGEI